MLTRFAFLACALACAPCLAQPLVNGEQRLDGYESNDFGHGTAVIGDVDGNGWSDLAIGTHGHEVFILFMGEDAQVIGSTRIRHDDPAFKDMFGPFELFGDEATWLATLNPFCYADCNDDGELSILDFICFQLAFQAGCD